MRYLITIRHGESYKNLKDISGGLGEGLTQNGIDQVKNSAIWIANFLRDKKNLKAVGYRSCDRQQLVETSDIIEKVTGIKFKIDKRYVPINLGVFSGMSGEKQRELYPQAAKEMQEWNEGKRDIMDVHVEGMQDSGEHVNRIIDFLQSCPDDTIIVLIGTRSDLSAIKNIREGNHPWKKNTFRFIPTDYAEISCNKFDINSKGLTFKEIDESNNDEEEFYNGI